MFTFSNCLNSATVWREGGRKPTIRLYSVENGSNKLDYFLLNLYNNMHNCMKKENSTSSLPFAPDFSDIKEK